MKLIDDGPAILILIRLGLVETALFMHPVLLDSILKRGNRMIEFK